MSRFEELTNELMKEIGEVKGESYEYVCNISNIVMALSDRRYKGGYNVWGLRFSCDSEFDPLYVHFTCIIIKRENFLKTDREDGLTEKDISNNEHLTAAMKETIRTIYRKGKIEEFYKYLVTEAIPCFLDGGNPGIFFL